MLRKHQITHYELNLYRTNVLTAHACVITHTVAVVAAAPVVVDT